MIQFGDFCFECTADTAIDRGVVMQGIECVLQFEHGSRNVNLQSLLF